MFFSLPDTKQFKNLILPRAHILVYTFAEYSVPRVSLRSAATPARAVITFLNIHVFSRSPRVTRGRRPLVFSVDRANPLGN